MTDTNNEPTNETFTVSRGLINVVVVGVVFMVAGVFMGMALSGSSLTAREVRNIVKDEFEIAIRNNLTESLVAAAGTTTEQMRAVVREEIAALELGDGALVDRAEPVLSSDDIESIVMGALTQIERDRSYMMGDGAYLGPEDAPVVIVEFSDFLCSFCGRHFDQTLTPILENFDGYVRYVYRHFPGVGGQNAVQSALATECARDQGVFWEYHAELFRNQSRLGTSDASVLDDYLISVAVDFELDMDEFETCYQNQTHINRIARDSNDAQTVGARGTPGFVINGRFVSGAQPYDVFESLILEELARLGVEHELSVGS